MPKGTKLEDLTIDKVSGVDWPAHLEPGWLVMKSVAGEHGEEAAAGATLAVAESIGKAASTISLGIDLMGGDADVSALVEDLLLPEDDESDDAVVMKAGRKVSRARVERLRNAQTLLKDLLAEVDDEPSEEVAKNSDTVPPAVQDGEEIKDDVSTEPEEQPVADDPTTNVEPEELLKSLPEPLRKQFEDMQASATEAIAKAAQAEVIAKAERDARLDAEYLVKARGLRHLPAKVEDMARIMRSVDENLATEDAEELHRVLRAADQLAANQLGETGSSGGGNNVALGDGERSAWQAIEQAAMELRKSETNLTREEAITKAVEINPELAAMYQRESRNVAPEVRI